MGKRYLFQKAILWINNELFPSNEINQEEISWSKICGCLTPEANCLKLEESWIWDLGLYCYVLKNAKLIKICAFTIILERGLCLIYFKYFGKNWNCHMKSKKI